MKYDLIYSMNGQSGLEETTEVCSLMSENEMKMSYTIPEVTKNMSAIWSEEKVIHVLLK